MIHATAHLATPEMAEPYYRVNAALLADREPEVVVPRSCKCCMGTGMVTRHIPYSLREEPLDCPDCDGTGTRMTL